MEARRPPKRQRPALIDAPAVESVFSKLERAEIDRRKRIRQQQERAFRRKTKTVAQLLSLGDAEPPVRFSSEDPPYVEPSAPLPVRAKPRREEARPSSSVLAEATLKGRVLFEILSFLSIRDLALAACVSVRFSRAVRGAGLWRQAALRALGSPLVCPHPQGTPHDWFQIHSAIQKALMRKRALQQRADSAARQVIGRSLARPPPDPVICPVCGCFHVLSSKQELKQHIRVSHPSLVRRLKPEPQMSPHRSSLFGVAIADLRDPVGVLIDHRALGVPVPDFTTGRPFDIPEGWLEAVSSMPCCGAMPEGGSPLGFSWGPSAVPDVIVGKLRCTRRVDAVAEVAIGEFSVMAERTFVSLHILDQMT
jgi:hypothetical protein